MSVIVKNMEMPKNCDECRFCVNGFTEDAPMYECAVQSYENVSVLVESGGKPFDFRPDWCPLVEIPTPHGRLGDLDALIKDLAVYRSGHNEGYGFDGGMYEAYNNSIELVEDAPTVIEAERSET